MSPHASPAAQPVQAPTAPQTCMPPLPPLPPPVHPTAPEGSGMPVVSAMEAAASTAAAPPRSERCVHQNVQCQAACMHAAQVLASEHLPTPQVCTNQSFQAAPAYVDVSAEQAWGFQPPVGNFGQHFQTLHNCAGGAAQPLHAVDMPMISQMLMREADAWRALMSLHGSVLNLARSLSQITAQEAASPLVEFDEKREASDQRQAAYLASVSQLTSQCDLLVAEAIKIRGLRKAKHQAEAHALREVMRLHSDEALAMGDTLARNSALNLAAVTSELRQAAQATRAQIQQARALLAAATDLRSKGTAPDDSEIVMGLRKGDGAVVQLFTVSTLLERVYTRGQLSEETLRSALWESGEDAGRPDGVRDARADGEKGARTFTRRAGDRQQLLPSAASLPPDSPAPG